MIRTPPLLLLGLAALVLAEPLSAQKAGSIELGGFVRYSYFDKDLLYKDKFGGGGRLGVYFLRNLALEADASYTQTDGPFFAPRVAVIPLHARLIYSAPFGGNTAVLFGAGYVHDLYRQDAHRYDDGAAGLVGLRLGLGSDIVARVDGTLDYLPYKGGKGSLLNFGVQAGLGIVIGNRHGPSDSDLDGVPNSADRCPHTPGGERVDSTGCTLPPKATALKDGDRDGVPDTADRCPDTPAGDRVDASGCSMPKDSDSDGIADLNDKCPNSPPGQKVDATGCAPPSDADQDGVQDANDRCPATPAGEAVDVNGCSASQRDGDKDGVPDSKDKCPKTLAGERVDTSGCPTLFEGAKTGLVLEGVNFETGKSTLLLESRAVLDRVAASLAANPELRVEVAGYTDSQGRRAANIQLSQARGQAVANYLIAKGVSPKQLVAVGYGPDKPVASNATAEGRAKNRRVELHRLN